jgi:hypothetical protein
MTHLENRRQGPRAHWPRILCGVLALAIVGGFSARAAASESLTEFHRVFAWSTFGQQIGRGGFEVVNPRGDNDLELLVVADSTDTLFGEPGHWYLLDLVAGELRQEATSFELDGRLQHATFHSSAGGGEIVATTRSSVEVFAGPSWGHVRSIELPTTDAMAGRVADLLSASGLELAVCDHDDLYLLSYPAGDLLLTRYGFGCRSLEVGQIDGDSDLELLLLGRELGVAILGGDSMAVEWSDVEGRGIHGTLVDVDSDGRQEVLYGLETFDYTIGTAYGVRLSDPRTDETFWELPGVPVAHLSAGLVDTDPDLEVIVSDGVEAAVYDSLTGAPNGPLPAIEGSVLRALTLDLDESGDRELVLVADSFGGSGLNRIVALDLDSGTIVSATPGLSGPFESASLVDLDRSGSLELVTVATEGARYSGDGRLLYLGFPERSILFLEDIAWTDPEPHPASTVGQLDSDEQLEICTLRGNSQTRTLRCEDSVSHSPQWEVELPENVYGSALAISDLDGDGASEIVATTDQGGALALQGQTGAPIWFTSGGSAAGYRLRIANVDGDAALEVLVGGRYNAPNPGAFRVFDGATGELEFGPFSFHDAVFETIQLDEGPVDVVVAEPDGTIGRLNLLTGELEATIADFGEPVRALRSSDLNRDGTVDLVGFTTGRLKVFDLASSTIAWSSEPLGSRAGLYDGLWIVNTTANGPPIVLADTFVGLVGIEAPLVLLFADGFESGDTQAWSHVQP